MQYLLLFLEGIVTFLSPCILPMLPIYISYFSAGEPDPRKTLGNALGFVLGFSFIFVALGAFAGTVGRVLLRYQTAFHIVTGSIVMIIGLNFIGVIRIGFLNRTKGHDVNVADLGFFSSMLFGLVFAVSWTPCVGAFLSSALMVASLKGSVPEAMAMLLTFSLGLGLPYLISAILIDRLKGAFTVIQRHYKTINLISGLFLIVIGILMATGVLGYFLSLLTF